MLKPLPFETRTELSGGSARVIAAGELDLATSPQLEREIDAVLGGVLEKLTVDLSGLTFVDSSGLRLLIALNERAQVEGWELGLVPPLGAVRTIFQISGADEHLPFVKASDDGSEASDNWLGEASSDGGLGVASVERLSEAPGDGMGEASGGGMGGTPGVGQDDAPLVGEGRA